MEKKEEIKNIIFKLIVILCISLFLEIFVFNINSFRLVGKDYQSKIVSIEDCELEGIEKLEDKIYEVTSDLAIIKIKEINQECATLYFDISKLGNKSSEKVLEVRPFYSDETSQELRGLPTKTIHMDVEETKYTTLQLSGKVNQINLNLDYETGTILVLNEFRFNEQIPFSFNGLRLIIVFGIIFAIYSLFTAKILDEKLNLKTRKQYLIIYSLGVIICILFSTYILNGMYNYSFSVTKIEDLIYQNSIYDIKYTEALSNGSLSLLMEVDEKLLNLENPYDETARVAAGFSQIYDYVYYDGAYYVYFSILPQLIMVPFHLLTGQYLNSQWLILLFMIFGVISTIKLIRVIFEKWFSESKFRTFILAILLVLFSNTLLYTIATPVIYELVAVLGYWLVTGGMYRIFKALKDINDISFKNLAIGSLMLASSVSARPNLIIISLLVIPIFIWYFIQFIKQKEDKKKIIKYVLAIMIPYLVIGISLMILNYVRFDSITEFGAIYQLTSNDMAKLGYRIGTIPIGIWHYFFNPPDISTVYPFINTRPNMPQYMGFYGTGFAGVGIFMLMPICILIFFLPILRKHIKEDYPKLWPLLILALIVAVISAIAVTLVGASYYRYSLDFIWLVSMVGVCLMAIVLQRLKKDKLIEKIVEGICIILTIYTICITLGVSVKSEGRHLERFHTDTYYEIKDSMSFWE